jgi:hypothetical protein
MALLAGRPSLARSRATRSVSRSVARPASSGGGDARAWGERVSYGIHAPRLSGCLESYRVSIISKISLDEQQWWSIFGQAQSGASRGQCLAPRRPTTPTGVRSCRATCGNQWHDLTGATRGPGLGRGALQQRCTHVDALPAGGGDQHVGGHVDATLSRCRYAPSRPSECVTHQHEARRIITSL